MLADNPSLIAVAVFQLFLQAAWAMLSVVAAVGMYAALKDGTLYDPEHDPKGDPELEDAEAPAITDSQQKMMWVTLLFVYVERS